MEDNNITKPDWIIHGVCDEGRVVYHTHGLNKYGSLELELNLGLNQRQAAEFINIIGLAIANGLKLKDEDINKTLFTCAITFKEVEGIHGDGERNLRIILPDTNFKFPWDDDCEEAYKYQI